MNYEITKLNQEYIRRIKQNKDLLVEAFTIYYGKEYYKYIKEKIDKIIIFWYIPPKIDKIYNYVLEQLILNRIELTKEIIKVLGKDGKDIVFKGLFRDFNWTSKGFVLEGYINEALEDRDYLPILKKLFGDKGFFDLDYESMPLYQNNYSYQEKIEQLSKKLKKEEIYRILPALKDYCLELNKKDSIKLENVLGTTNLVVFNEENKRLHKVIQRSIYDSYAFQVFSSLKTNIVGFPILLIEDKEFIHELNHALKNILFTDTQSDMVVSKSGLSIMINGSKQTLYLEEIINDRQALDITDIFHSLGGSIFREASLFGKEKCEDYQKFFPLINDFYNNYLEIIKKASIGENLNYLFSQIDKEAYGEYSTFVENTFIKRFEEELKIGDIEEAQKLVGELRQTTNLNLRLKKKDKA